MDKMKAIVCPKYGTPDVLQVKEVDKPHPKKMEVLIKIHSSTVTMGDCRIISFNFAKWFWLPGKFIFGFSKPREDIPGWELSGIVEKVGSEVTKFKEGDSVFGFTDGIGFGGTNAEYKCLPQSSIVPFSPKRMQYDQAAVLSIGGLTALYFLRKAKIEQGYKVLINGASGSVGTYAVQLAKSFGAEVTGVCSNRNIELVQSLGADHVIDYTVEDFAKNGRSYDVIFDTVDKISFKNCKNSLSKEGIYLTVDWPFVQAVWASLASKKKIIFGMAPQSTEDMIYLRNLVERDLLKPVIDRYFVLGDAVEAYKYVDNGHKVGNVVIKIE